MSRPFGICIDCDENVFVCGGDSNNVHMMTIYGEKQHKVILNSKDDSIREPNSIAYRQEDGTMIIGSRNSDDIVVVNCKHACR